jgi:L-iditol 2-dehydrogenase
VRKAVITGPGRAEVVSAPDPRPANDIALVEVRVAPMCGEYKAFVAGVPSRFVGHEAAGEIVAVDGSGRLRAGDRVVAMPLYGCGSCRWCVGGDYLNCVRDSTQLFAGMEGTAAMASHMLKPERLLVPIPDGISYEHASMACCGLGASFGSLQRLEPGAGNTLLVTGLGPVGLGAVINARHSGARVIGVESQPFRSRLALELGAAAVIDPRDGALDAIRQLTDGAGVDMAVDCSGVPDAHRLCIDAVRPKGSVGFVGESSGPTSIEVSRDLLRKQLTLIGTWHYNLGDAGILMQRIAELGPSLDRLITHVFALDDVQRAWETQASGDCGKVLLRP